MQDVKTGSLFDSLTEKDMKKAKHKAVRWHKRQNFIRKIKKLFKFKRGANNG